MDVVSIASSFATLAGFAMQLYGNCKWYLDAAKNDCPNDLKLILIETASLKATLSAIEEVLRLSTDRKGDEARLQRQIGKPVQDCIRCLQELAQLVPDPMKTDPGGKHSHGDKLKLIIKAIKWSLSEKEKCATLLDHLRTHKATLSLGLSAGLSEDVKKIAADVKGLKASVNTMEARLAASERAKIYKWLAKVNPSVNHNTAGEAHERGTGEWLARSPEWRDWLSGSPSSRLLWLHGIPGAGKTVLAYVMVKQVGAHIGRDRKKGLAYYYCYHGRTKDESVFFLSWVLNQLCRASDYIPQILDDLYQADCEPTAENLLECLAAVLTCFSIAYVVLDAVDESYPRTNLVRIITTLGADHARFGNLRLAVTSRDYQDIEAAFRGRAVSVSMSNENVDGDIAKYVTSTLFEDRDRRFSDWDKALKQEVAGVLTAKARGMFQYAAAQLDILAECDSTSEVRRELKNLPATLEEMYERVLRHVDPRHREDVVLALALIIGAQEEDAAPLRAQTLVSALESRKGRAADGHGLRLTVDKLKRYCVCLITVGGNGTVDLAHFTVREFLQSGRVQQKLPAYALPADKASTEFLNTILSRVEHVSRPHHDRAFVNIQEDENDNPYDFELYALRRARLAMYWSKRALTRAPETKRLLLGVLNPYAPAFRGLQLACSDGPADPTNRALFEWLPRFNDRAGPAERAAAHLTMVVGFEQPGLVRDFLSGRQPQEIAAMFATEMRVLFPAKWDVYRTTGAFDREPLAVTVLGFFTEGLRRGYDTKAEVDLLRAEYGRYLSSSSSSSSSSQAESRPSSANTAAQRNPAQAAPTGRAVPPPAYAPPARDPRAGHGSSSPRDHHHSHATAAGAPSGRGYPPQLQPQAGHHGHATTATATATTTALGGGGGGGGGGARSPGLSPSKPQQAPPPHQAANGRPTSGTFLAPPVAGGQYHQNQSGGGRRASMSGRSPQGGATSR